MIGQQVDVRRPLAERRQPQRDGAQPVVEVLAKQSLADHRLEIAVGGGDHRTLT